MKKRVLATAIAVISLCAGNLKFSTEKAQADTSDSVKILVDEPFENLDLYSVTEYSSSVDWIFNMLYDTLITLDEEGNFCPGLAREWRIIPTGDGSGESEDGLTSILGSSLELFPWAWETSYPLGWKEGKDVDYNPSTAQLNFFDSPGTLIVEFDLREDVVYADGTDFDAEALAEFLLSIREEVSSNTLIYKQWKPVIEPRYEGEDTFESVTVVNNYTIRFELSFTSSPYGWMDFLYGLASPLAGIGRYYGDETYTGIANGTGAYLVVDKGTDCVELQPNEYWALGDVAESNVKFTYIGEGNENARAAQLMCGQADVAVIAPGDYNTNMGLTATAVADDPLFLFINPDCEELSDITARAALSAAIQNNNQEFNAGNQMGIQNVLNGNAINPIYNNTLTYEANGLWALEDKRDLNGTGQAGNIPNASWQWAGVNLDLVTDDSSYHVLVAQELEMELEALGMSIEVEILNDEDYEERKATGNYDLMIKEIEVSNINSVHNETYDILGVVGQALLDKAKTSADKQTYLFMYGNICSGVIATKYWINLGWPQKIICNRSGVSGITFPISGYNPTGDVSRIDFRGVSVTTA